MHFESRWYHELDFDFLLFSLSKWISETQRINSLSEHLWKLLKKDLEHHARFIRMWLLRERICRTAFNFTPQGENIYTSLNGEIFKKIEISNVRFLTICEKVNNFLKEQWVFLVKMKVDAMTSKLMFSEKCRKKKFWFSLIFASWYFHVAKLLKKLLNR